MLCVRLAGAGFVVLEPCVVKVTRPVLRGRGGGNITLLPDTFAYSAIHCAGASFPNIFPACTNAMKILSRSKNVLANESHEFHVFRQKSPAKTR